MSSFHTILSAYGVDVETTMGRFMGNEAMYLRLLRMLVQDENLDALGRALDAGDLDAAFAAAHTLKGVAGNMGLTPLYDRVCAIVAPLRAREAREDYPALYGEIRTEFQRVLELKQALEGGQGL